MKNMTLVGLAEGGKGIKGIRAAVVKSESLLENKEKLKLLRIFSY